MKEIIVDNPYFGIVLTLFFFQIGKFIFQKTQSPLCNPLMIATVLILSLIHI